MNERIHPIMAGALAPFVDWMNPAAAPAHLDAPIARLEVSAELRIGTLWIADIEGEVSVYRDGDDICIDEMIVFGQRQHGASSANVGRKTSAMSFREITDDEAMEHLCARAFGDLLRDPKFIEDAEEALAKVEREWVSE